MCSVAITGTCCDLDTGNYRRFDRIRCDSYAESIVNLGFTTAGGVLPGVLVQRSSAARPTTSAPRGSMCGRRGVGAQSQSRQDRGRKNPNSHPDRVRSRHSKFDHSQGRTTQVEEGVWLSPAVSCREHVHALQVDPW